MRYDSEHKARTRERVLKEAAKAIRIEGADRMAVATVMNRAGLTHGGFYAHFKSKDDLLGEAVRYMFDERYGRFLEGEGDDPAATLRRFVDAYMSMLHRGSLAKGCPVPILAGQIHRLPEAAQTRFADAIDRLVGRVADLLERLGLKADVAHARAASVLAQMVGTVALSRAYPDERAAALLENARISATRDLLGDVTGADAVGSGGAS